MGGVSMMSAESEGNEEIVQSRLEPIFFFNNDVDQADGNFLDTYEICTAITEVVGSEKNVDRAQRIGGLWRLYLKEAEARGVAPRYWD